jgi:hypothetical protein
MGSFSGPSSEARGPRRCLGKIWCAATGRRLGSASRPSRRHIGSPQRELSVGNQNSQAREAGDANKAQGEASVVCERNPGFARSESQAHEVGARPRNSFRPRAVSITRSAGSVYFHRGTQRSATRLAMLRRFASPWALFESPAFAGLGLIILNRQLGLWATETSSATPARQRDSPNRAAYVSLGQRPGIATPLRQALKGRSKIYNTHRGADLGRPFRASDSMDHQPRPMAWAYINRPFGARTAEPLHKEQQAHG